MIEHPAQPRMTGKHPVGGPIRPPGGWQTVSCPIRAKVVVDGKSYCGVHDPAKAAGVRAKSDAIFAAKRAVDSARWDIAKNKAKAAEWAFANPEAGELVAKRDAAAKAYRRTGQAAKAAMAMATDKSAPEVSGSATPPSSKSSAPSCAPWHTPR